ncbi:Hypothetical predicted protein [Podarcis lilfordi]|uniref:Uncharacterized protein n=1 Tax=Podarcis lilfordi TaxID=74358 RepID=A0AA35KBH4_9SAUR|nr:Hypothetical predicted protein [Podarcis lilfordi]
MEFNKLLSASGGPNQRREEEARASAGGTDAGVSDDLDFAQMYLTCLPERYMEAKFTLTAYLACWLILKLCKRALEKRCSASQKVGFHINYKMPPDASSLTNSQPILVDN